MFLNKLFAWIIAHLRETDAYRLYNRNEQFDGRTQNFKDVTVRQMVHSWEKFPSSLNWILCHRFLEMERTKTFIDGPGVGRLANFSWKDDVINQTGSNKNISTLILNKIINKFLSDCGGSLFIPMVYPLTIC